MNVRVSPTTLRLVGTGTSLPGPLVNNDELLAAISSMCGGKAAKLAAGYVSRLGIESRHLSRSLERPRSGVMLGRDAPELCRQALNETGHFKDTSFLIGHTATPHTLLPSNVAWVAEKLDYAGPYMELRQACTGFATALTIAAGLVAENPLETISIVGSETGSPYFEFSRKFANREQLINCVQMGDGAGAAVLSAVDGSGRACISEIYCGHIGLTEAPGISIHGAGSSDPTCDGGLPYFRHDARSVRRGGEALILAGIEVLRERGHRLNDFDWILPHQANGHIAEMFAQRFPDLGPRVFVIAREYGNLGSAAIWIGLDRLIRSGLLKRGHRVAVLGAEASKYMIGGFIYTH